MKMSFNFKTKKFFWWLVSGLLIFNLLIVGFLSYNFFRLTSLDQAEQNVLPASDGSVPVFDRNNFMSVGDFTSNRACGSQAAVQQILENFNSPLKDFTQEGKSASYWIYESSRGSVSSRFGYIPQLNPCLILAYLQKEQSLLTSVGYDTNADPQGRIRKAMGYGCPDNAACAKEFEGFKNQVTRGAWQLWYNYKNAEDGESRVAPYLPQTTIATLDGYNVYLSNAAVASNYRYTPHVCWGNYNLWKWMVMEDWMAVSGGRFNSSELDNQNRICFDGESDGGNEQVNYGITYAQVEKLLKTKYSIGYRSAEIETLQKYLRQEGYYTREISNLYGTELDKSVTAYRIDNNIIVESTNIDMEKCKNLINKDFQIGDENQEVADLQRCLSDLGVFDWPVITGYYGPVTNRGQLAARKALSTEGGSDLPINLPETNPIKNFAKTVRNNTSAANLNFRNSACGAKIGEIPWNTTVEIYDEVKKQSCLGGNWTWTKISYQGKTGWVAGEFLQIENNNSSSNNSNNNQSSNSSRVITVSNGVSVSGLNQRSSACGSKLREIPWGTRGVITNNANQKRNCFGRTWTWVEVDFGSGRKGWVVREHLNNVSGNSNNNPNNNSGNTKTTVSRGAAVKALNIRRNPCSSKIGEIPWGRRVQVISNSRRQSCLGGNWTWVEVEYSGVRGWVADYYLG